MGIIGRHHLINNVVMSRQQFNYTDIYQPTYLPTIFCGRWGKEEKSEEFELVFRTVR